MAEGEPVLSATTDRYTWQLRVSRSPKGETCLEFAKRTREGGASRSGACGHRPPLAFSSNRSEELRFLLGVVTPKATSVRVEHAGGGAETFPTATATARGFDEAFFAGEISQAPVTRVVALDAGGREVAESREVQDINGI